MPKETWMISGILTVVVLLGLLSLFSYQQAHDSTRARSELVEARSAAAKALAESSDLRTKLADVQAQIENLQQEQAVFTETHKGLEDELRAAHESKDVTISQLQGKLTVNILDRVLFDSGEAELKPDGESVLCKVSVILIQHPMLKVHVVGHTDNIPIRAGARSRFASNWELSTTRATAAVRFLTEACA